MIDQDYLEDNYNMEHDKVDKENLGDDNKKLLKILLNLIKI